MASTVTIRRRRETTDPKYPKIRNEQGSAIDHAVRLIHAVCGLAGSATWIDDIRADLRADKVQAAIRHRDTAVVFDWLMAALSYQGIADAVAYDYMERHGRAAWRDIDQKLGRGEAHVWRGLLSRRRLRRAYSNCRRADRCPTVQSNVSADLPSVRPVRDLAVLQPERPRRLQWQPD
jgi:hypothetical protein